MKRVKREISAIGVMIFGVILSAILLGVKICGVGISWWVVCSPYVLANIVIMCWAYTFSFWEWRKKKKGVHSKKALD